MLGLGRGAERERDDSRHLDEAGTPGGSSDRTGHAREPSATTTAAFGERFEQRAIGPLGPDPYTHERT